MNKVVKDFIKLSKELNYNPISLAVAWVIYNQDILSPIISARNLKQLVPSLDSMKISITKEIYESINKITRTPPPATDRLEDVRVKYDSLEKNGKFMQLNMLREMIEQEMIVLFLMIMHMNSTQ